MKTELIVGDVLSYSSRFSKGQLFGIVICPSYFDKRVIVRWTDNDETNEFLEMSEYLKETRVIYVANILEPEFHSKAFLRAIVAGSAIPTAEEERMLTELLQK